MIRNLRVWGEGEQTGPAPPAFARQRHDVGVLHLPWNRTPEPGPAGRRGPGSGQPGGRVGREAQTREEEEVAGRRPGVQATSTRSLIRALRES